MYEIVISKITKRNETYRAYYQVTYLFVSRFFADQIDTSTGGKPSKHNQCSHKEKLSYVRSHPDLTCFMS